MTLDFAKNTKLITSVNLGLLVLLAYVLVDLFWLIILPKLDNNQLSEVIIAKPVTQDKMPQGKALFGKKSVAQPATEKKIVKTKLNLELKGIWLNSKQPQKSYVIIKISNADKIFYLNDKISSLATLVEINSNFVVLDRSGQLEALYLRKNKDLGDLVVDERATDVNNIIPKLNTSEKSHLNKIRKDLKNNPWKLSQILNVKPSYKSGKLRGFEIRPGKERRLFYKLKLEPGDIVHSINGRILNLSTMQATLDTVINNNDISIGIYRKNDDKTLILKL